MDKKKRKGYNWKPATHRWVRDRKNKWLTNSSFWYPKKKKLRKSIGGEDMISSPLLSLFEFLNKQSPEVASRMAARGLIWSPERHRWIRKPDISTEAVLPQTRYAQQGFGSIGAPSEPEKPASTSKESKLTALEALGEKLSTWEKEFLSSVKDQLKKRGDLSDKQWAIVNKIEDKFKQQADIESGAVEAQPLPPVFKKLDKLKKFMPEKHVQAIESMANQVKAGGTLSPKQEDYLNIIEENAQKQKKGLTEPATGNIIIRPSTNILNGYSSAKNPMITISGKGAFHPQGRKWLEENGFEYSGPGTGQMHYKLPEEDLERYRQEAKSEFESEYGKTPGEAIKEEQSLASPEMKYRLAPENTEAGKKYFGMLGQKFQTHIDDLINRMPELRDKGFTLKHASMHRGTTPKVWKMLLGRK